MPADFRDSAFPPIRTGIPWGVLLLALTLATACASDRPRVGVVAPDGSPEFTLMDFATPLDVSTLPEGWSHRIFRTREPMQIDFVAKDGRDAIRLETRGTASMLFRQVDVPIDRYPRLTWEWQIEQGIDVAHDEMTIEGDDHPARLYLTFVDPTGEAHAMEIIWGNRVLQRGDWKHLGFAFGLIEFPHYVANGGAENEGRWHREDVDLREIVRTLWGDPAGVRLTEIALFCDTDETGARSVAYFGPIRVRAP